ncbi:MAG: TVP38/TMEM64 family protein [Clostridia bacterium]|nr:TVP38/TMEM64 family protein [Clostridia bacterium]
MKFLSPLKTILNIIVVLLLSVSVLIFTSLYLKTFSFGFIYKNQKLILYITTFCVCLVGIIAMIFSSTDNAFIYKLTVITLSIMAFTLLILYLLKISGILDKIDSVESLRKYVASFGYLAILIYVIMNVLQVVVLPIPGFIAIATGVALFGAFKTAIYSFIGIVIGSFLAFFIGRYLGSKVVVWLIGENALKKWEKSIRNKDKLILTFMFLFPFFPDDVLCFIAGLSSMSTGYFVVMILVCRTISVFTTAYSVNGSIIPYTTWWGLLLWGVIIILTIILTVYLYKNGDKFDKYLKKLKGKKKLNASNSTR